MVVLLEYGMDVRLRALGELHMVPGTFAGWAVLFRSLLGAACGRRPGSHWTLLSYDSS